MSQAQFTGESRQRVLTVELRAPEGDAVSGVLVLPFGLHLDDGVSLAVSLLLLFQKAETRSFELSRIAYADAEPGQYRDGA